MKTAMSQANSSAARMSKKASFRLKITTLETKKPNGQRSPNRQVHSVRALDYVAFFNVDRRASQGNCSRSGNQTNRGVGCFGDQKLVAFLNHVSMIALQHPQHRLLLILASIEFCGSNSEIRIQVRSIYRRLYSCVEHFIHQGQVQGTIRADIHSHELTSIVMAYFDGTLIEWHRRPGELDGKSLTSAARLTLLDGIRAKPQSAARSVHKRAGKRAATNPQY